MNHTLSRATGWKPLFLLLSVLSFGMPDPAGGAVAPSPEFTIHATRPLVNDLGFQVQIGCFTTEGNLLVGTRDDIGPGANHNVLRWDGASDAVLSGPLQYPAAPRYIQDLIPHETNNSLVYLLDGGRFVPPNGEDGRLCLMHLSTGVITPVNDVGKDLVDPVQMDRDPVTGDIFIADRGDIGVDHDGAVRRWHGDTLTVFFPNIDAHGLSFLSDGTYYLNARIGGLEAVYHVTGSTILDTVATGTTLGTLTLLENRGAMPAGLYIGSGNIDWLPDGNGDFHADSVVSVATGAFSTGIVFDDSGRLITSDEELNLVYLAHVLTSAETGAPGHAAVRLCANAPNPFNPSTTVIYELIAPGRIDLVLYDISGREVAVLARGESREAGAHRAVWDGRDSAGNPAPSGVYFVRLSAGAETRTGKMVLLK